jgi:UDP-N-acetylmuramyl pentapeptide synthase
MYQADSRLIQKGDTFIALPGAKVDGHTFLEEVSQKGALEAYVQKTYSGPSFNLKLHRVPDPLLSLQQLAREKIGSFKGKTIAVTGSIGKTTTKEFIAQILSTKYKVTSTIKSQNTKITLPLTILNHCTGSEDFIVLEMGMTHPGDIGKLVSIAPPDIALLTQVAHVHASNFSSHEDLYKNKFEIFSSPRTSIKILWEQIEPYTSPFHLMGEHNLKNLSMAIHACKACGMNDEELKKAIPQLALPEKRLELIQKGGFTLLNDSYNACWLSTKGAIDAFSTLSNPRKIAVFGDMVEQGSLSKEMHQNVVDYSEKRVENMFLLGTEWNQVTLPKNAKHFLNKKDLLLQLKKDINDGDAILIKGSNFHQLWTILEEL